MSTLHEAPGADEAKARKLTLTMLARRAAGATICPSEVARALAGNGASEEWRKAMPAVHAAADGLLQCGAVQLSWKGEPLEKRSGPYRIAQGLELASASRDSRRVASVSPPFPEHDRDHPGEGQGGRRLHRGR